MDQLKELLRDIEAARKRSEDSWSPYADSTVSMWGYMGGTPGPISLTLADGMRMQNVLYESFATWYATGEVTGKMFEQVTLAELLAARGAKTG